MVNKALTILIVLSLLPGAASAGAQSFTRRIVEAHVRGDNKGLADLDGDGDLDLVITIDGGGAVNRRLVWYAFPDFERTLVRSIDSGEFTTDLAAGDVDGDGDVDVITTRDDDGVLRWHENPRPGDVPSAGPWTEHVIGTNGGSFNWVKDLSVLDADEDGRVDVLARSGQGVSLWMQKGDGTWSPHQIVSEFGGEGMETGDLDGDGRPDLVAFGAWWKMDETDPTRPWSRRSFAASVPCGDQKLAVGDVDLDGHADILLGCSEESGHPVTWYRNPGDGAAEAWPSQVVGYVDYAHTLQLADVDDDGDVDLFTAETSRSDDPDDVLVLVNDGSAGFQRVVVDDTGLHNGVIGDVDGDGDVDLFGSNFGGDVGDIYLWLNDASTVQGETDEAPRAPRIYAVYPQPAHGGASFVIDADRPMTIAVTVFDLLGRAVLSAGPFSVEAGSRNSVEIDLSTLPSGSYVYRARSHDGRQIGAGRIVRAR